MKKSFENEMVKPIYELATVMGVFPALERNVLQQWIARKLIIDDEKQLYEERAGRKRLYSGLDMVKMMVIRVLSWQGLALPSAARLAKLVAERCRERVMESAIESDTKLSPEEYAKKRAKHIAEQRRIGINVGTDEQIVYFTDNEKGEFKYAVYYAETPTEDVKTPLMFGVIQSDKIIDDVAGRIYGYLDNEGLL